MRSVEKQGKVVSMQNENEGVMVNPSRLVTIDQAIFDLVQKQFNLFTETNKGFTKVPVKWVAAERAFQSKKSKDLRDSQGTIILPLITIERRGVIKNSQSNRSIWGTPFIKSDSPGDTHYAVTRRIKQDKSANFTNAQAKRKKGALNFKVGKKEQKTVYETVYVPIKTFVDLEYVVTIRTEQQAQMNDLMEPFITKTAGNNLILAESEGHSYEVFIDQNMSSDNTVANLGIEERIYTTEIKLNTLGYVTGEGVNDVSSHVQKTESAVDLKLPREPVILSEGIE